MGVARCPFADQVGRGRPKLWNPDAEHDPRGTPGGAIVPRCVIVHSEATKGLARPGGNGLEWHFMVRRDGRILQHVDTARRADANNKANAFAVSIETEDDGDPDREPWTDAQLWALERLIRWVCTVHRIPLRRCPSWSAAGVGYHTMWGAPSPWTPVAKTCPGRVRIRQFDEVLMPRLLGEAQPPPDDDQEVARMFASIVAALKTFWRYDPDESTWKDDEAEAAAWWFDVAAEHGEVNAVRLLIAKAREAGRRPAA